MAHYYEKGDYKARVLNQGFGESKEKKTPLFFFEFEVFEAVGANNLPERVYPRRIEWYITDGTIKYVKDKLRGMGWEGTKLQELEPGSTNHHSFVDQEIIVTCVHDGEYDKFDLAFSGSKPAESVPGIAKRLDTLFGKQLMADAPKGAKKTAKPAPATVPPAEDDDPPF